MIIDIYTDGACSGNPGPGGFGVLMRVRETGYTKTFSGGYEKTTNNRMELLAVIFALRQIKILPKEVHIHTDSKYVADAIEKKWLDHWKKKGFQKVKNPDMWRMLIPLLEKYRPKIHWIKGHAGHTENEICDQIAVQAASQPSLPVDTGYIASTESRLL